MPSEAAVREHFTDLSAIDPLGDPAGQKAVYAATLADGTLAVLKIVELPVVIDEDTEAAYNEAVGRLRREISILSAIDSPHVTKLALAEHDLRLTTVDGVDCAYYLERRIGGPSVEQMLAAHTVLSPQTVARLGSHVARGIQEFWSRDKVHRDIKPANIMHDEDAGVFVLLDAGYALDLNAQSYTRVYGIVGTLPYFSPEQLNLADKRKLDFRSDLYALGVVMYCALAGAHPYLFPGMSQDQQFEAIATARPVAPIIEPGSEPLWEIVLRLLEKQPHARYKSCEMVDGMLNELY